MLATLVAWLYTNVWGNLVASFLAWIIAGSAAWFWKIRPHIRAQRLHREAEVEHREHVCTQLAKIHEAVKTSG